MLWAIAGILLVLWFFGLLAGATLNGLLHVLLMFAAMTVVIQVMASRQGS